MPTPLHLSDEEIDVLLGLAAPIAYERRREFMEAVAAAAEQAGVGSGVGLVHRVAREVQGRFVLEAQRETSLAAAPRHLRARQAARSISHEGVARVLRAAGI
jgi:hypothetical protein